MNTASPERRALAFVVFVIALSAAARLVRAGPAVVTGAGLDLDSLGAASAEALDEAERRARPLEPGERIQVNTAPAVELARLPRVGPTLARRIVDARDRAGFGSLDDLMRVPGIGPRTAEMLAPHLDFGGLPGGARASRARARAAARTSPASRYDVRGKGRPAPGAGVRVGAIDLNRADSATLRGIPGIGPVLARRIVAFRDSAGPFASLDALTAVPGIGPVTVRKWKEAATGGDRQR